MTRTKSGNWAVAGKITHENKWKGVGTSTVENDARMFAAKHAELGRPTKITRCIASKTQAARYGVAVGTVLYRAEALIARKTSIMSMASKKACIAAGVTPGRGNL